MNSKVGGVTYFLIVISFCNMTMFLVSVLGNVLSSNQSSLTAYEVVSPFYYLGYIAIFWGTAFIYKLWKKGDDL